VRPPEPLEGFGDRGRIVPVRRDWYQLLDDGDKTVGLKGEVHNPAPISQQFDACACRH
jgi:hypothetical protein